MIALIDNNRDAIAALCKQYRVQRLAVFGSAVRGTFNEVTSDLDFVIEMADYGPGVAKRFIYFANALESLFDRSVDLVFESKLSDPKFRAEVMSTMEVVFDGEGGRQAVA